MKNNIIILAIAGFAFLSCASTTGETQSKTNIGTVEENIVKNISVQEFKNMISEETIILDVRTPKEFAQGHLKNAININYFDQNFIEQVTSLDKSKALLIHCAVGGRSAKAMNSLKGKGFSKLYNMLGGYNGWVRAGYPVVK